MVPRALSTDSGSPMHDRSPRTAVASTPWAVECAGAASYQGLLVASPGRLLHPADEVEPSLRLSQKT